MALIGQAVYDPTGGAAVVKSTAALLAMTAFDTTNLRVTFTVPANGIVQVRAALCHHGGSAAAYTLLGILEGSTVVARISPFGHSKGAFAATHLQLHEAVFTVGGLTPGASKTWDLAYGVEVVGGTGTPGYKYGGPDNTTGDDSFGAAIFEVHDAPECLATRLYDPAVAVTNKSNAALSAMAAFDTANLRHTITATSKMQAHIAAVVHGGSGSPGIMLGIMESTTIRGRMAAHGGAKGANSASAHQVQEALIPLIGLSGTVSLDAAWAVETLLASSNFKYGGGNDTTANNAFGGFLYELWDLT